MERIVSLLPSDGSINDGNAYISVDKKQWVCFVCTDMRCSPEDILRIYTMRWACAVYFSIAKGYLKLRTECHSTSYDAITAHMVIAAIRYMILAVTRFENTDNHKHEFFSLLLYTTAFR